MPPRTTAEGTTTTLNWKSDKTSNSNWTFYRLLNFLKQGAEIARRESTKGQKDTIDILTLLFYAPIRLEKYSQLLKQFKKGKLKEELINEIKNFNPKDSEQYLGISFQEFQKKKKELIEKLKKLG